MSITNEQLQSNKVEFIELVNSIKRENMLKDQLIDWLSNSDFFVAPASKRFHCSFEGGLCEHSLNVYKNLLKIVSTTEGLSPACYDDDTLKIVALFHDISKTNFYTKGSRNVKVYSPEGKLSDSLGNFYWNSVECWDNHPNRFVYGSHEMTSEYILRQYIPLTLEESVAITHHMGSMSWDSAKDNIGEVYNQYPLALVLYIADMMSTYITEKVHNE